MTKLNLAIFAYNEQDNIANCLKSVFAATSDPCQLNITVLINGSTDNTLKIVTKMAQQHPQIKPINIELGDKSNAWNHYIYSDINASEDHFFMDGDTWLPAGALDAIVHNWLSIPCYAVAPLPIGVSQGFRAMLTDNNWLSGTFYGLSSEFITKIRNKKFKLPIGFIGDDSAIMYIVETNFNEGQQTQQRVLVVEETGPVIPRLSLNWETIKLMHNRYKRYAIRHFQQEVLYYLGRENKIDELPEEAKELKKYLPKIGLTALFRFQGLQTLYHPYALIKILLD